ncbi:hypothetical protein C9I28_06150 [Pseudoduganella armeniaca]|uniref:Uncharacterized protein n=1 Tax=Pseudoduganella armeniaca TaxID=2072590 RepID=A0A2R4C6U6_9BURK|nr:hypothetical protein C9I28_06150 [Pseudoduganella armeniaca]
MAVFGTALHVIVPLAKTLILDEPRIYRIPDQRPQRRHRLSRARGFGNALLDLMTKAELKRRQSLLLRHGIKPVHVPRVQVQIPRRFELDNYVRWHAGGELDSGDIRMVVRQSVIPDAHLIRPRKK